MFRVNALLWFFRYIGGFLTVVFYGEFPEKILNLTTRNKIYLWNSRLIKNGIESCISIKDFRSIRTVLKNSGIKVHILKRHGLPFKIDKNRKRVSVLAGALIFVVFLSFMSGRIWIIDVEGNSKVSREEIVCALEELGIKEGVSRKSIDPKKQREKLLLKIDSLAWASINAEGCRLTVNVSEIKSKKPQNNAPANLKAKADGIITKIDVKSGNCIVKKGDTVKAGDILVSGIIERLGNTNFVRSSGTVTATTERSITVSGDFKQTITEETGKIKHKRVLELFTLKIPLYLGSENGSYNEIVKTETASLFNQNLPIRIYEKEFRFTKKYELNYSEERLKEKLSKEIKRKLQKDGVKEYKIISEEIKETENGISLTQIVTSEENIAVSEDLIVKQSTK